MKRSTSNKKYYLYRLLSILVCLYLLFPLPSNAVTKEDGQYAKKLLYDAKNEKTPMQTFAHLNAETVRSKTYSLENLAKNKTVIEAAIAQEKLHSKDYYVFYTAIPYMMLFQDVALRAYTHTYGKIGAFQKDAFQFIRYNYTDPVFNQYHDVTDFLLRELNAEGIINDTISRLKTILVSTNLALFANTGFTGESTWHFFSNPQKWVQLNPAFLINCLKYFGYPTTFAPEFLALNEYLIDTDGNLPSSLMQIFIPKKLVNAIGYVAWRHGIPFDPEYIQTVMQRKSMTFGVGDQLIYEEIKKVSDEFQEKWRKGDPQARATVLNLMKKVVSGAFHLNPFLDQYMKDPESIRSINYRQARLLITNSILLNPKSGVEIYRYHTPVPPERLKIYLEKMESIFMRMDAVRDALKTKNVTAP